MSGRTLSRVRAWLGSSQLPEGARMPPERTLATSLGVSRAELRKALLVLEAEGRLERKVGRGTFLTNQRVPQSGKASGGDIASLAERTGPHEAMIARLALEPQLAQMAALHATPRQLTELRRIADAMHTASTWQAYEDLDAAFHDLIAESAGNALLHDLHKIMNGVRMIVVWRRLNPQDQAPTNDYHSFREHEDILHALETRDRQGAERAMRSHLQSTLRAMTAED